VDDDTRTLQELIDDEDLDGLLARVSLDDIAATWCEYHREDHSSDEEAWEHSDWWAIDLLLTGAVYRNSGLIRNLLMKLVEHADEIVLGSVGAGPLENFVSDDEADLQWIEAQCASNEKFRTALGGVWCASYVSEATMVRLDTAAGVCLARPLPRDQWPPERLAVDEAERRLIAVAGEDWSMSENPTPEQLSAQEAYFDAFMKMVDLHTPGAYDEFKRSMEASEADE
jgi:hypothetical protein